MARTSIPSRLSAVSQRIRHEKRENGKCGNGHGRQDQKTGGEAEPVNDEAAGQIAQPGPDADRLPGVQIHVPMILLPSLDR